jgi:predicted type IV restriction endonuclease
MGQYKEEDLSRWRGLVSEQVASGKSVSAFCRERGLRVWQFYEWKKRLRKPDAAAFVAIAFSKAKTPAQQTAHTTRISGIEIRHRRGWSLIVEPGFDAGHLHRLLSVLEMEA